MGGAGSGRHSTCPTTVEDYEALAIESLVREGLLQFGYGWTKTLSRNGEAMRSISAYAEQDTVVLSYRVRDRSGGAWKNVEQQIRLDYTAQPFGGSRAWFRCPSCDRRCGKLHGGERFYCRSCLSLSYQSQHEGGRDRLLTRAQSIRQRLGGSADMSKPFPERPRRMHRRRYERLRSEALMIEERFCQAQGAWLKKLIHHFDRKGGHGDFGR